MILKSPGIYSALRIKNNITMLKVPIKKNITNTTDNDSPSIETLLGYGFKWNKINNIKTPINGEAKEIESIYILFYDYYGFAWDDTLDIKEPIETTRNIEQIINITPLDGYYGFAWDDTLDIKESIGTATNDEQIIVIT
jgi:hypothetical protein